MIAVGKFPPARAAFIKKIMAMTIKLKINEKCFCYIDYTYQKLLEILL